MDRVYPKIVQLLDKNMNNDIFSGYDVIWEDDTQEQTEMVHRLRTEYDFAEANNALSKTLKMMKESEGQDFDDEDFDTYKKGKQG